MQLLTLQTSLQAMERLTINNQRKGHLSYSDITECRHKKTFVCGYAIVLMDFFSSKNQLDKRIFWKG